MTDPRYVPLGLVGVGDLTEDHDDGDSRPLVGADDARADAAHAGARTDLSGATRDGDGVPVGAADAEADRARAAGEQD
ncbi:hypothetical protein ACPFP2_26435 [Micromonospora citrea]|uniref:hypothetical protein n=1 Tax=Micromonospora citrea TaxID=47855 RepID=UPI003C532DE4